MEFLDLRGQGRGAREDLCGGCVLWDGICLVFGSE